MSNSKTKKQLNPFDTRLEKKLIEYQKIIIDGQAIVIKKSEGAARGILKDIEIDNSVSDEQSLQSIFDNE